jgi:hypothetical protein
VGGVVKTVDLRRRDISVDELLQYVGADVVRITSKEGEEFLLEAADAFEREVKELGQSAKFMAFLAARSAEPNRVPLANIESRFAAADPPSAISNEGVGTDHD